MIGCASRAGRDPLRLVALVLVLGSLVPSFLQAAVWDGYSDGPAIERRLKAAAGSSGGLTQLSEFGRTSTGEMLRVARIGSGESASPALLLVAGLDGRHLHGVELALRHIEALSADPESTRTLLAGATLYVVPTFRPDAVAALRARPARARATSAGVGDADRDGAEDEDRADDLDGDGVLRWVRLADGGGDYRSETERPEIVHPADRKAGLGGTWRLLSEGRDDDGDQAWNEEEDGGVLLSRNFPHGYEWFARGRGPHQVSEPETRALADFLVLHPEIGTVLVYGFEDNLLRPWPEQRSSDPSLEGPRFGRRPVDAPNRNDLPYFRELSDRYLQAIGLDGAKGSLGYGGFVTGTSAEGDLPIPSAEDAARGGFAEFSYYDRGLVALATPVWTPGAQLARLRKTEEEAKTQAKKEGSERESPKGERDGDGAQGDGADGDVAQRDGAQGERADGDGAQGESPKGGSSTAEPPREAGANDVSAGGARTGTAADSTTVSAEADSTTEAVELPEAIADEARFLDWLRSTDPAAWKEWETFTHPDFPDRRTEVGGYAPLARIAPPIATLDELFAGHQAFLAELLGARPRLEFRSLSLRRVDGDVYSLEIEASNEGYLPDVLAQGVYATLVRPTRFELTLPSGAEVLGAGLRGPLERMAGSGGGAKADRLLRIPGGGEVEVSIVSEHGGRVARRIGPGETWRRP